MLFLFKHLHSAKIDNTGRSKKVIIFHYCHIYVKKLFIVDPSCFQRGDAERRTFVFACDKLKELLEDGSVEKIHVVA